MHNFYKPVVHKPGKTRAKKLRDAINEYKFISIGSDAGRVGHARVKWGHDMNDDDFEEVMVKSNASELGRSQSGGARYDKNALPAIYQNGQYSQYPNGYRGSSSYPSLNGSKNYPLQQVNMLIRCWRQKIAVVPRSGSHAISDGMLKNFLADFCGYFERFWSVR